MDSSKIPVGKANGLGYCYLDRKISRYVRRDGVPQTTYYEEGTKGQLISKADWRALDSPKKRSDEFDLFAMKSKKANKTYSSVRF